MSETNVERLKSALNLDREPFSDEGVAGLFFPGGGRQALLDQLLHLSRYGPPLLLLLGDNGVGKSTLLDQLRDRLDPSVFKPVLIKADVLADENLLLEQISRGFSLDLGNDWDSCYQAITRYAKELDSYSQTPLIMVDEGQNLSLSAIAFLQSLVAHGGKAGLRCLLVVDGLTSGNMPLLEPIVSSGMDFQALRLDPLDQEACDEYISYRMTTSGLADIQFSSEQMRQIYQQSKGNIDRINIVAREILVEHFPYQKNRRRTRKLPVVHTVSVALLAVVLLVSFLWSSELDQESAISGKDLVESSDKQPVSIPSNDHSSNSLVVEGSSVQQGYPSLDETADTPKSQRSQDPPIDQNKKLATQAVVQAEAQVGETLDSFVVSDESVDFNFEEAGDSEEILQPVEVGNRATSEVKTVNQTADSARETVTPAKSEDETEELVAKVVDEGKSNSSQDHPQTSNLTAREKWLLSLDKEKYTLQMLGAREEASVQKHLARYPSLKEIAYHRTRHKDKDWYVVVYGQFASKEQAKIELTKLPASLQASKPWARPIANVQEEIRKR